MVNKMNKREKTDTLAIHCSATPATMDIGVEKIKEWHVKENGWSDVGYHFIITRSGELQKARPEEYSGAHAPAVNFRSLAVCLIGGTDNNQQWENNFTEAQFDSLKSLILDLIERYEIKKILGHYQVDDRKECPSFNVPEWLEKNGLKDYVV